MDFQETPDVPLETNTLFLVSSDWTGNASTDSHEIVSSSKTVNTLPKFSLVEGII